MGKRKFYTALPLLVLPFLTLFYWSVAQFIRIEPGAEAPGGLNTSLPDASLKEKNMDKLAYYKKAAEDSLKKIEMIKRDPYRQLLVEEPSDEADVLQGLDGGRKYKKPVSYQGRVYSDPGEAKVYAKLKELEAVLADSAEPDFDSPDEQFPERQSLAEVTPIPPPELEQVPVSPEIQKLLALASGTYPGTENLPDPEIEQLHALLDKIISVQQPEKAVDPLRRESETHPKQVFPVEPARDEIAVTLLEGDVKQDSLSEDAFYIPDFQQNGFFSLDDADQGPFQNTIPAVVHQDQVIVTGTTVKFRLVSDVYIAGQLLRVGTFLFGTASVTGERLKVAIGSIRMGNALFPVRLSVWDLDGLEGIHVPGALSRDVAKQSLGQDIQGVNLGAMDPSLGAQAVNAGIQTARTLMGRKTRLVQVKIQAGYQVLMIDSNAKPV